MPSSARVPTARSGVNSDSEGREHVTTRRIAWCSVLGSDMRRVPLEAPDQLVEVVEVVEERQHLDAVLLDRLAQRSGCRRR